MDKKKQQAIQTPSEKQKDDALFEALGKTKKRKKENSFLPVCSKKMCNNAMTKPTPATRSTSWSSTNLLLFETICHLPAF